jgi:hypothetical protein
VEAAAAEGHDASALDAQRGAEAEALVRENVPAEQPRERDHHVVKLALHAEEHARREPELRGLYFICNGGSLIMAPSSATSASCQLSSLVEHASRCPDL